VLVLVGADRERRLVLCVELESRVWMAFGFFIMHPVHFSFELRELRVL
jgi:hypothetical protein